MNTPNIRFKGYTDDWVQRKLGDLFNVVDTKHATAPITDVKTKYRMIRTDCVRNGQLIVENTDSVTKDIYEQWSERIKLQPGDLVFTREAPMGESAVVPCDDKHYFPGQRIVSLRAKGDVDTLFINNLIYGEEFRKEIYIREAGSSTVANFGIPAIKDYSVMVPSVEEQKKIGCYLNRINNLIALNQRKCDALKKLKKGMLQKMFPKDGEKVPEFRFKGFTGDWEQRKLEELVERVTRKNTNLESELPLTISAQYGLIDQNEFFDKRIASRDVSGYYLVYNGEFAYNKSTSNDAPWGAIKRLDRYEKGVLSTLYIVFAIKDKEKTDTDYLSAYYDNTLWHKEVYAIAAEGARNHGLLNIAPADFFETKLVIPKSVDEQRRIGRYFKELDNLITLHQRQCNDLKEVKKFMLQNMFPEG